MRYGVVDSKSLRTGFGKISEVSVATKKIQSTKNYRLFTRSEDNRETDLGKHEKLMQSMKVYGFIPGFPIVVRRGQNSSLIVKDGQHRLLVAETLGLPVYWVEEEIDFSIAMVNSTAKTWLLKDYAKTFAKNGLADYQDVLDFHESNKVPISIAFSLLAGVTEFTSISTSVVAGKFKIKDRSWADAVVGIYNPLVKLQPDAANARLLKACMAVCRVLQFDQDRLLRCAERCRDKLVAHNTRDACLEMLEKIYNFGQSNLFALKLSAQAAMRDRNPSVNTEIGRARLKSATKSSADKRRKTVVAGH
jgi:hypothetical protein